MKNLQESDPMADLLGSCEERRCQRLVQVCLDPGIPDKRLDYEDLFYPARCHRQEELVLVVETAAGGWAIEYGSGDFFYEVGDETRTFSTAVDPRPIYQAVQEGRARVRPRFKDELHAEAHAHD